MKENRVKIKCVWLKINIKEMGGDVENLGKVGDKQSRKILVGPAHLLILSFLSLFYQTNSFSSITGVSFPSTKQNINCLLGVLVPQF